MTTCYEAADSCTAYTEMTASSITTDCPLLFDIFVGLCGSGIADATDCSYSTCEWNK